MKKELKVAVGTFALAIAVVTALITIDPSIPGTDILLAGALLSAFASLGSSDAKTHFVAGLVFLVIAIGGAIAEYILATADRERSIWLTPALVLCGSAVVVPAKLYYIQLRTTDPDGAE